MYMRGFVKIGGIFLFMLVKVKEIGIKLNLAEVFNITDVEIQEETDSDFVDFYDYKIKRIKYR